MKQLGTTRAFGRHALGVSALAAALALHAGACTWFDVNAPADRDDAPQVREPRDGGGDGDGEHEPPTGSGGSAGPGGQGGAGGSGGSAGSAGDGAMKPDPDASIDAGCDASDTCDDGGVKLDENGDFTWHPIASRFAVTNDPSTPGALDRVWLLVDGGSETPRRLVSSLIEATTDNWLDTGIWGITSELDGVSFSDAQKHYQRVFFAREGQLQMLRADVPLARPSEAFEIAVDTIAAPAGYTIGAGDLAAALYEPPGGERSIVVLAPATFAGTAGYYCIYQLALAAEQWSLTCSAQATVHAETDVAAVAMGSELHFYFRGLDDSLVRVARQAPDVFQEASVPLPAESKLAASLWAMPSEFDGLVQLIVVTQAGELWSARPPADRSAPPEWTLVPALPDGQLVSTGRHALAAIVTDQYGPKRGDLFGEPFQHKLTELRVIAAVDGQHYFMATDDHYEARPWMDGWATRTLEREQRVRAIGGMTWYPVPLGTLRVQVGAALCVTGGERTTALQESVLFFANLPWRDHLRPSEPVALPSAAGVAELSSTSGPDRTVVAMARRSAPPFTVDLLESNDGATTFASVETLETLPRVAADDIASSALEPTLGYGGGKVHLTTLEWALDESCADPAGRSRRVVYRRADNAAELAALSMDTDDVFIASGQLPHASNPTMVITEGMLGAVVHIVFNAGPDGALYYWRLPAGETETPDPIRLDATMPSGPAALAAGVEDQLWVASYDGHRFALCPLGPEGVVVARCTEPDAATVKPLSQDMRFGAELSGDDAPDSACAPLSGRHYKCTRDDKPFSITVDKWLRHQVLVAFTAADVDDSTSVFVASYCGSQGVQGDCSSPGWREPVAVSSRPNAKRFYFDPEITVDLDGEIVVSYASLPTTPSSAPARSYIERAHFDPKHSLVQSPPRAVDWDTASLPYDCVTRRWALGSQRQSDIVDSRSLHVVRDGSGHSARWLGEYMRP